MHISNQSQVIDPDAQVRMPILFFHDQPEGTIDPHYPWIEHSALVSEHHSLVLHHHTGLVQLQLHSLDDCLDLSASEVHQLGPDELLDRSLVVEVQDGEFEALHLRNAVNLFGFLRNLHDLLYNLLQRYMRAYLVCKHFFIVIISPEPNNEVIVVIVIIHLDLVILPLILAIKRRHNFFLPIRALELQNVLLSSLEPEGVGEFFVDVAVGDGAFRGEGDVQRREGALWEVLCSLVIDYVDCMLTESALGVAAFRFEVVLAEGAIVVIVGGFLASVIRMDMQILLMCQACHVLPGQCQGSCPNYIAIICFKAIVIILLVYVLDEMNTMMMVMLLLVMLFRFIVMIFPRSRLMLKMICFSKVLRRMSLLFIFLIFNLHWYGLMMIMIRISMLTLLRFGDMLKRIDLIFVIQMVVLGRFAIMLMITLMRVIMMSTQ